MKMATTGTVATTEASTLHQFSDLLKIPLAVMGEIVKLALRHWISLLLLSKEVLSHVCHVVNKIPHFDHKPSFKIFPFALIFFLFLKILSIWKFGDEEWRLITCLKKDILLKKKFTWPSNQHLLNAARQLGVLITKQSRHRLQSMSKR